MVQKRHIIFVGGTFIFHLCASCRLQPSLPTTNTNQSSLRHSSASKYLYRYLRRLAGNAVIFDTHRKKKRTATFSVPLPPSNYRKNLCRTSRKSSHYDYAAPHNDGSHLHPQGSRVAHICGRIFHGLSQPLPPRVAPSEEATEACGRGSSSRTSKWSPNR